MTPKLPTERLILREIKGDDLFGYYDILSDKDTMKLLGGPTLNNDLDSKNFVQEMKTERERGISYFWAIILKEEKEFIGFVRLMSYNSVYYDLSFGAMGELRNSPDFLKYINRKNGWEIEYALLKNYRNNGIMKEAVGAVLKFCKVENIVPVYAKVNHVSNTATVNVLRYHNFQEHFPMIDQNLLGKYDHKTIIENNEYGMAFIWNG